MLSDGIAQKVQEGTLAEGQVEVLDISEVLQRGRLLPMAAQGVKGGGDAPDDPSPPASSDPRGPRHLDVEVAPSWNARPSPGPRRGSVVGAPCPRRVAET